MKIAKYILSVLLVFVFAGCTPPQGAGEGDDKKEDPLKKLREVNIVQCVKTVAGKQEILAISPNGERVFLEATSEGGDQYVVGNVEGCSEGQSRLIKKFVPQRLLTQTISNFLIRQAQAEESGAQAAGILDTFYFFSADGSKLFFTVRESENYEILKSLNVIDLSADSPTVVTIAGESDNILNSGFDISTDGKNIAYLSTDERDVFPIIKMNLNVIRADGSGKKEYLKGYAMTTPQFINNNSEILVAASEQGSEYSSGYDDLYVIKVNEEGAINITNESRKASIDFEILHYHEYWLALHQSGYTELGYEPKFSSDGKYLLFRRERKDLLTVTIRDQILLNLATKEMKNLTNFSDTEPDALGKTCTFFCYGEATFSPDSQKILLERTYSPTKGLTMRKTIYHLMNLDTSDPVEISCNDSNQPSSCIDVVGLTFFQFTDSQGETQDRILMKDYNLSIGIIDFNMHLFDFNGQRISVNMQLPEYKSGIELSFKWDAMNKTPIFSSKRDMVGFHVRPGEIPPYSLILDIANNQSWNVQQPSGYSKGCKLLTFDQMSQKIAMQCSRSDNDKDIIYAEIDGSNPKTLLEGLTSWASGARFIAQNDKLLFYALDENGDNLRPYVLNLDGSGFAY